MDQKVPVDEVRLLRKVIEGIDMIYSNGALSDQPKADESASSVDSAQLMRQMMAINKIELLLDRILYILAESPYCRVSFESQENYEMDLRIPVHAITKHFKPDELIQVHRSYVVNPKRVLAVDKKSVKDYEIWLKTGRTAIQIPIGRSYTSKLRKQFPQWFKKG